MFTVNLTFAVKLIFMPNAWRQFYLGNIGLRWRNAYLFAIQIIAIFNLPCEVQIVLVLLKVKGKGLVSRDKIRATRRVEKSGKSRCAAKKQDQRKDALSHER